MVKAILPPKPRPTPNPDAIMTSGSRMDLDHLLGHRMRFHESTAQDAFSVQHFVAQGHQIALPVLFQEHGVIWQACGRILIDNSEWREASGEPG